MVIHQSQGHGGQPTGVRIILYVRDRYDLVQVNQWHNVLTLEHDGLSRGDTARDTGTGILIDGLGEKHGCSSLIGPALAQHSNTRLSFGWAVTATKWHYRADSGRGLSGSMLFGRDLGTQDCPSSCLPVCLGGFTLVEFYRTANQGRKAAIDTLSS